MDSSLERVRGEILLLFHPQDHLLPRGILGRVDWLLNGQISHLLRRQRFSGLPSEILLLSTSGKFLVEKALVVGLGWKRDLDREVLLSAYREGLMACARMKARGLVLTIPEDSHSLFAAGEMAEILVDILDQAVVNIPGAPGLQIAFYEPDRERREMLEAYLQEALPALISKFDFSIEIVAPQGDQACGY